MKKFFWALMLVATTLSFVACEEDKPVVDEPNPDQTEVCKDCGKNPCECEKEEVCDVCGKNPCECEQTPEGPEWCTSLFEVNFTCDETGNYEIGTFDYSTITNAEGQTIQEYLGYADWAELAAALGTFEEAKAFDRELQLFGIDLGSETDVIAAYNTNGFGYWVDANGVLDAWATETCRAFTEAYAGEDGYLAPTCHVGVMPGNLTEGDTYKFGMIFQRTGSEVLRAGVQISIKVEAFKDPEEGKYPKTATAGTHEIDFEATISLSSLEYAYQATQWREQFETVKTKLGMTMYEFANPSFENVLDDDGVLYTGRTLTYTLPDGTTGTGVNVWLNADNQVVAWGESNGCVACIEWGYSATDMYASTCVFPGAEAFYSPDVQACVGKTFEVTYTITYIPDVDGDYVPDQDPTVINMNFAVTIAE